MRNLIIALLFSVGLTAQTFDFSCVTCNDPVINTPIEDIYLDDCDTMNLFAIGITNGNLGRIEYATSQGVKSVDLSVGFINPHVEVGFGCSSGARTYGVVAVGTCSDGTEFYKTVDTFTIYWE